MVISLSFILKSPKCKTFDSKRVTVKLKLNYDDLQNDKKSYLGFTSELRDSAKYIVSVNKPTSVCGFRLLLIYFDLYTVIYSC